MAMNTQQSAASPPNEWTCVCVCLCAFMFVCHTGSAALPNARLHLASADGGFSPHTSQQPGMTFSLACCSSIPACSWHARGPPSRSLLWIKGSALLSKSGSIFSAFSSVLLLLQVSQAHCYL